MWKKSSLSSGADNCVEVTATPDGDIAVRNSNRLDAGVIPFTRDEMSAFVGGVKNGEFDEFC